MGSAKLKAVFFDFDSTISTPIYVEKARRWAVADNTALFKAMSVAEQRANLGGDERIAQLDSLFCDLKTAGVQLYIVSIGFTAAFGPHLRNAGLLAHFDAERCVFGQDCSALRSVNFVKGKLIEQIMLAHGWTYDQVLFIDDSEEHIRNATTVCRTLHVVGRKGMTAAHLNQVRQAAVA